MTIALIPARGGSKGIPGKNMFPILGKPLIQYSIEVALESTNIDEVWVSSDSEEILSFAASFEGVKTHRREKSLATDTSSINDTVSELFRIVKHCKYLILLQPTSPIRDAVDIANSLKLLKKNSNYNSVISVCAMNDIHPARMYWSSNSGLEPIMMNLENIRRQDIPTAYYRNGSIYIVKREAFMNSNSIMAKPIVPYEMPRLQMLNIDEPVDLLVAEVLIKKWLSNKNNATNCV